MEKNIERLKNESLVLFADRLSKVYNKENTKDTKKCKGQFFTPITVAKYMATLSKINKRKVHILDPGAGVGILSAALIEELSTKTHIKEISLVCYELDKQALPYLKRVLEEAKITLSKQKILFEYQILDNDFIHSNADKITPNLTQFVGDKRILFDIIISNPPYFKINKKDLEIPKFAEIISGQANIYCLFMAISARLLSLDGEMIFITPRSFCSGLYYSQFRKWLMQKVSFTNIHLFESRKELFSSESVLQENIITRYIKKEQGNINISKSLKSDFLNTQTIEVMKEDVIYKSNGHIFFRIPSNEDDLYAIRKLDQLPYNFYKLGIKISTGKVVAFRNKEFLSINQTKDSVPLIWMHNLKAGKVEWPVNNKNKAISIKSIPLTKNLLLQAGDYLVLKRFSAKEQRKRFETAIITEEDFKKFDYFALDNMVNYIYSPKQKLSKNQIKGIAKYLDLPIVDLYFRVLNGHTQVNANEVYALPFPSLEELEQLGRDNQGIQALSDIETNKENFCHEILESIQI